MNAPWSSSVADTWRLHERELREFVSRLAGSASEADDLMQSTFETLLRIGPRDSTAACDQRTLMFGVAANTVRHHRRSVARFSALRGKLMQWSEFEVATPEHHAELAQLRRDFEWATEQLPEAQREVIVGLLEGLTAAEVARRERETESTVRSRSMYAKRQLRTLMKYGWLFALAAALAFGASFAWRVITIPPPKQPPIEPSPMAPIPLPSLPKALTPRRSQPKPTTPSAPTEPPSPKLGTLYDEAHQAQFVERDLPKAIAGWNRYLASNPTGALADDARFFRAVALFKDGRLEAALGAVEGALATEPTSAHAEKLLELQRLLQEGR